MSQIGSHPAASRNVNPKARSHRRVVLRRVGYTGAGYLFVLTAAAWIDETRAGGATYLYLAVPTLALTFLAHVTARGGARGGSWPDRRLWHKGENRILSVLLPAGMTAEPRVWHFAPLLLLALWTLLALFRAA